MADDQIDKVKTDQVEVDKEGVKTDPSDSLTPEHPRFKQVLEKNRALSDELETLKSELGELKETITKRQEKTGDSELNEEEKSALEKLDKAFKQRGYLTKNDLEEDKKVTQQAQEMKRLAQDFDGTNGYPKFDSEEVLVYAKTKEIGDLEEAYYSLHRPAIIQAEAKKITAGPQPPVTEKATGTDREIGNTQLTPEKIAEMSPAEYEANREKILASMKNSIK